MANKKTTKAPEGNKIALTSPLAEVRINGTWRAVLDVSSALIVAPHNGANGSVMLRWFINFADEVHQALMDDSARGFPVRPWRFGSAEKNIGFHGLVTGTLPVDLKHGEFVEQDLLISMVGPLELIS